MDVLDGRYKYKRCDHAHTRHAHETQGNFWRLLFYAPRTALPSLDAAGHACRRMKNGDAGPTAMRRAVRQRGIKRTMKNRRYAAEAIQGRARGYLLNWLHFFLTAVEALHYGKKLVCVQLDLVYMGSDHRDSLSCL